MSRINRVPKGLQDLLGSQNLGVNPSDLSAIVQTMHDMFPHWAADRLTTYRSPTATAAANTNVNSIVIPNGEAWIPIEASVDCEQTGVGDAISYSFGWTREGLNNQSGGVSTALLYSVMYQNRRTAAVIGERSGIAMTFPMRVQFGGTVTFTTRCYDYVVAGAGSTLTTSLTYYRLFT